MRRSLSPANSAPRWRDRVARAMTQRKQATQDARAGEVFAECVEKIGFAIFESGAGTSSVLRGRKRVPERQLAGSVPEKATRRIK
jgi:hypothetical protein